MIDSLSSRTYSNLRSKQMKLSTTYLKHSPKAAWLGCVGMRMEASGHPCSYAVRITENQQPSFTRIAGEDRNDNSNKEVGR